MFVVAKGVVRLTLPYLSGWWWFLFSNRCQGPGKIGFINCNWLSCRAIIWKSPRSHNSIRRAEMFPNFRSSPKDLEMRAILNNCDLLIHEDSCWAAGRRIQCAVWKRDLGLRFVAQVLRRRGICQAPASVTYLTLSKAPRNKLSQSSVFECYLVTAQYSRRTSLQVDRNYENLLRRITRVWKCTWLSQLIFSGDATNSLGQYRRPRPEGKSCGEKKPLWFE
jgi:hypothetical protein